MGTDCPKQIREIIPRTDAAAAMVTTELAALTGILIEPRHRGELDLKPEQMADPHARIIFGAIVAIEQRGEPWHDTKLLADQLQTDGHDPAPMLFLLRLAARSVDVALLPHWLGMVTTDARRRLERGES